MVKFAQGISLETTWAIEYAFQIFSEDGYGIYGEEEICMVFKRQQKQSKDCGIV